MACKGICSRYIAKTPWNGKRYAEGISRCTTCSLYIKWTGMYCPCCGGRVRAKPRAARSKLKYNAPARIK